MEDKVLEFIKRRFAKDCFWVNDNCYYFAVILKDRFQDGTIYYDDIYGHFIFEYHEKLYDWTGIINRVGHLVEWDKFYEYDSLLTQRIVRDCIM